jgi:uncharacterized protein
MAPPEPGKSEAAGARAAPKRRGRRLARMALALAIGTVGGAVFWWLSLPLPWMLGALCASTVAAMAKWPIASTRGIRPPLSAVIGIFLGSGFTPELFQEVASWLPSLLTLLVFLVASGGISAIYLHRAAGFARPTAFYAAMPAGMVEMVLQGGANGGDERWIALIHGGRILVVVFTIPFLFQYFGGFDISGRGSLASAKPWPGATDVAILTVCAVVGWWLAALIRLPAAQLTGPMLLSAAVHLAGLTAAAPPRELVNIAQIVLGTSVGSQFIGTPLAYFAKALGHSLVVVFIMLGLTLGLSLAVAWAVPGIDLAMMILALAPGGLIEMGLIALALGADLAFVSLHQLLRIFLITFAATWLYRLLFRGQGQGPGPGGRSPAPAPAPRSPDSASAPPPPSAGG